jgi:hypothetical protein
MQLGIDWHRHRAEMPDSIKRDQVFGTVLGKDRNAVSWRHTLICHPHGKSDDPLGEFAIAGHDSRAGEQGRAVPICACGSV